MSFFESSVIVVGGGTTGLAAAIAAARGGVRTMLVEQCGFLGGNAAIIPGWLGFHSLPGEQVVGGIAYELVERMQADGTATRFERDPICGSVAGVSPHWWKVLAAELVDEEGIATRLHTRVVSVNRETDGLRVGLDCRGTIEEVRCKVLVDCTDTGEVARMAGAQFVRGREEDNRVQVASWAFTVGNVQFDELITYLQSHPSEARPFRDCDLRDWFEELPNREAFVLGAFPTLVQQAIADGLPLTRENVPGIAFPQRGEFFTVASRVEDVNPSDPTSLTRGELEGARQARHWMRFLRGYVPGFADCWLAATPHQIGLRETNHLVGDYTLTGEDLLVGKPFADGIACGAYHLDVHSPDHAGLETAKPPVYQIPYRSLLPRHADGVLVAGRCISATHRAMASTRVIPISMAIGQAAGIAAAMASELDLLPRGVPAEDLRSRLADQGAILG